MDNTQLSVAAGGDTIRTLDKTGTGAPKTEVVALDLGGGDGRSEAIASFPLPVKLDDVPVDDDGVPLWSLSPSSMDALEILFRQTIAASGYPQTPVEQTANVIPPYLGYPPGDARRYGMVADGVTDCTVAFQNALNANAGFGPVYIPKGTSFYNLTARVTAPANSRIIMAAGAELKWTATTATGSTFLGAPLRCGLEVIGDNFAIEGAGKITGPATAAAGSGAGNGGVTAYVANESAIARVGPSAANRGKGFGIRDCEISLWGAYGIVTQYMQDVLILNHVVHDVGYAGIAHHSALSVREYYNKVYGVAPGTSGNAYGITHTHDSATYNTDPMVASTLTAITAAASAVATISVVSASNPFAIGQNITFSNVAGMTQISGLSAAISAIGGSSGAWTVTVPINSTGFSAFVSAPVITAITKASPAVVTLSTVSAANPYLVGNVVTFAGINGMTQMNGLNATIIAIGGVSGAWTITVNVDSTAFSVYTSAGTTGGHTISCPRQALNPFCIDMDCGFNEVRDIPIWIALDAHGCYEGRYHHNTVYNCHRGLQIASSSGNAGAYAGDNNRVEDNTVYGWQINGNATTDATGFQGGIIVNGGALVPHRGVTVARNHFYGMGHASTTPSIYCLEATLARGVVIESNTFHNCVGRGIYGLTSSGVIAHNYWDSVGQSATGSYCIYLDSFNGTWTVVGNIHAAVNGTCAPYTNGFNISLSGTSNVSYWGNDFTPCTTPVTQLSNTSTQQIYGPCNVVAPTQSSVSAQVVNGVNGFYAQDIHAGVGATTSYGQRILAGTGTSDIASQWVNAANSQNLAQIRGDGAMYLLFSPLQPAVTRVTTGLAAYKTSDTTAVNNTLTADATLTLTFNETGKFEIEIGLFFWEATTGTGGFQFDLNSGTATIANILLGVTGWSTAAVTFVGDTTAATAISMATIAIATGAPSWMNAVGSLSVTGAGTLAIRWAQNSTNANATTLKQGSYIKALKIA